MWILALVVSALSIAQYYYNKQIADKYIIAWGSYVADNEEHYIKYTDPEGEYRQYILLKEDINKFSIIANEAVPIYIDINNFSRIYPRNTIISTSFEILAVIALLLWIYIFLDNQWEISKKVVDYTTLKSTAIRLKVLTGIGGIYEDAHKKMFEDACTFLDSLDEDFVKNMSHPQIAMYTKCNAMVKTLK